MTDLQHQEIAGLSLDSGVMLLQNGAESALVESVARRIGLALGLDRVEVAIMANAVTMTAVKGDREITRVRRNDDQGINVHVLIEIQRVLLALEAGIIDGPTASRQLGAIRPYHYSRWIVVVVIAASCASFARLAHADLIDCTVAFVASGAAMAVRQWLSAKRFSAIVTFFASAFVATSFSAQSLIHHWGSHPNVAMASSCLLLVPGVPLINGFSDMVKGYINTGIARWSLALMLCFSTAGGIILAMTVWNAWAWL